MNVHFSSETDLWATPQDTFDALNAEFGPFDVDVCAVAGNAKCARFYTPETDGLAQDWAPSRCWMNPPYGRTIARWMCMRRPILNNSKRGDFVYEPFSGSGTTIIAAEQTGRKCLAVELNPVYVDVAVRRWENFSGKKAVLLTANGA